MVINRIITFIDNVFQWITRLAILNGLWLLFSIMGLLVGGVFPSTTASLSVIRKWLRDGTNIRIWKTFKHVYKKEFARSNILGWILITAGILLYVNYRAILSLSSIGSFLYSVILFSYLLLLFFYTIVILWSFPILVHYDITIKNIIKHAVVIGLAKLHYSIACGLYIISVIYLSIAFPGAFIFFSFSVGCFGVMFLSLKIFTRIDNKQTTK